MNSPKISVITPCLNRAGMISNAIDSILAQGYPDFEHIIVDGNSTDGTLNVLDRYPHLKVFSEPDHNMYDAINKGLKLAQGAIIGFLNTDDLYAQDVLKEIAGHFTNAEVEAVAGRAEIFRLGKDGSVENGREFIAPSPENLLERTILGNPAINAWFFRSSIFEKIGVFNTGYRIIADQEFMIRLALANIVYARTDHLVYRYRRHSGSLTLNGNQTFLSEITQEHLKMSDDFLRKAGLPDQARQYLRKMRTRDTLMMAIFRLHRGKLGQVWFYACEGIRSDWAWPLKFTFQLVDRLIQYFLRWVSRA